MAVFALFFPNFSLDMLRSLERFPSNIESKESTIFQESLSRHGSKTQSSLCSTKSYFRWLFAEPLCNELNNLALRPPLKTSKPQVHAHIHNRFPAGTTSLIFTKSRAQNWPMQRCFYGVPRARAIFQLKQPQMLVIPPAKCSFSRLTRRSE
jgi:hypothetical protein